jgi:hypothetical protein
VPRVPLPNGGITRTGETCTPSPARTLLLGHRSYGLIRQSRLALLSFGLSLVQEVFAGCYQPLLPPGSSRRYFCESFLGCLSPCHGAPMECLYLFLPPCHRPSPKGVWVGFPLKPANTTFCGAFFEAAAISLCSGLRVCSSPTSFLPLRIPPQRSRDFLHPGRTCFVASARPGHASRPNTGNWRRRDFHPARFAALSAAPPCVTLHLRLALRVRC